MRTISFFDSPDFKVEDSFSNKLGDASLANSRFNTLIVFHLHLDGAD